MSQRIYLVANDGTVSNVCMPYDLAIAKLREGEIEEVYEVVGDKRKFKGVRLLETKRAVRPEFYRPTLGSSDTSISDETSFQNAGYYFPDGPQQPPCLASYELIQDYPKVHDDRAVNICARMIYGATEIPREELANL